MKKKYYEVISSENISNRKNTAWYVLGSTLSSVSSVLLLMFTTRILGGSEGGVFSIGWSIAQLSLTVGWFGSRNFQVSDVNEKYQDGDYFFSKVFTMIAMFICAFIYSLLLGLTLYKLYVTCLLTLLMGCDVIADVFSGFFQKHGKLHITGKSYAGRNFLYDMIFIVVIISTHRIDLSIICAIGVSYTWLFFFDYRITNCLINEKWKVNISKVLHLLKDCFPIFISAFLTILITNIPKNAIELLLDDKIQNMYNIIFMPSSVINLLGMFVFVPLYTGIANNWANHEFSNLKKKIIKICSCIFTITLLACLTGYLLGIPVLSWLYGVQLDNCQIALVILLIGGGINCLLNFLSYIITVIRKQKILMLIYLAVVILSEFISTYMVGTYQLLGAVCLYLLCVTLVTIGALIIVVTNIRAVKN